MDSKQIQSIALEVLSEIAPDADIDNLVAAKSFRDQFEFDSVDYLNFVMHLEKRFEIHIPEVECPRLASLDGCVAYLTEKLGA